MKEDLLIEAEGVSKKFCRTLKRSFWYGVKDAIGDLKFSGKSPPSNPSLAETSSLLRKDEFWALKNVSFRLKRGECLGLIGHNGAGKSTLLKILNGLIKPDTGRVVMRGRVGALIELSAGFNPVLTGRENIYNRGALFGFSKKEIDKKFDAMVEFAEIGNFLDMPVQNYSSGMKVRLGFAVSSQMEPDVLIVDEVLAVGDVGFRFKCLNAMSDMLKNAAVIFVSHSMPMIFRICTEVMVLDQGRITFSGRDLAKGVEGYYDRFKRGLANVAGSGQVELLSLQIKSSRDSALLGENINLKHNESIKLVLNLSIDKMLDCVRMQMVFWNSEMLPVIDVVDEGGEGFVLKNSADGKINLETEIDRLPLGNGRHALSVIAISLNRDRVFLRYDNAAFLTIVSPSSSGAHVLLNGRWAVNNNLKQDGMI